MGSTRDHMGKLGPMWFICLLPCELNLVTDDSSCLSQQLGSKIWEGICPVGTHVSVLPSSISRFHMLTLYSSHRFLEK